MDDWDVENWYWMRNNFFLVYWNFCSNDLFYFLSSRFMGNYVVIFVHFTHPPTTSRNFPARNTINLTFAAHFTFLLFPFPCCCYFSVYFRCEFSQLLLLQCFTAIATTLWDLSLSSQPTNFLSFFYCPNFFFIFILPSFLLPNLSTICVLCSQFTLILMAASWLYTRRVICTRTNIVVEIRKSTHSTINLNLSSIKLSYCFCCMKTYWNFCGHEWRNEA